MPNAQKDVIVLDIDPSKWPDLTEYFSRKNPGDKCVGTFKATLAENGEETVVLNVDDIEFSKEKDNPKAEAAKKSPAARVFKGKETPVEETAETLPMGEPPPPTY